MGRMGSSAEYGYDSGVSEEDMVSDMLVHILEELQGAVNVDAGGVSMDLAIEVAVHGADADAQTKLRGGRRGSD